MIELYGKTKKEIKELAIPLLRAMCIVMTRETYLKTGRLEKSRMRLLGNRQYTKSHELNSNHSSIANKILGQFRYLAGTGLTKEIVEYDPKGDIEQLHLDVEWASHTLKNLDPAININIREYRVRFEDVRPVTASETVSAESPEDAKKLAVTAFRDYAARHGTYWNEARRRKENIPVEKVTKMVTSVEIR